MHPEVAKFAERFEAAARRNGSYRRTLGRSEELFLELVWGPAFEYNFEGLEAEYPLQDFKNGERFIDFVYVKDGLRLMIEIDGYTTHARHISSGDFDDHLMRQNDFILSGWTILRFSAHQVERKPRLCQRQITQALGHWWTLLHGRYAGTDTDIWSLRKKRLVQLAVDQNGMVRIADIITRFSIKKRTAINWMQRFTQEGMVVPVRPKERIIGYQLSNYHADK